VVSGRQWRFLKARPGSARSPPADGGGESGVLLCPAGLCSMRAQGGSGAGPHVTWRRGLLRATVLALLWPAVLQDGGDGKWRVAADHPSTAQEAAMDTCMSQNRTTYQELQVRGLQPEAPGLRPLQALECKVLHA
jgi:hypothetical protein